MLKPTKTQIHRPDFILLGTVLALTLFGLLMVYDASPVTSLRDFGDSMHLIRLQIVWAVGGLALGLVVFKVPYPFWQKLAPLIIIFAIFLLLSVFIPGLGAKVYGAQRWLRFGAVSIQPAEFAKLAFVLCLASSLSKKVRLPPFLLLTGLLVAIVLAQNNMGTAMILTAIGLAMYFAAGGILWHILVLVPAVVAAAAVFIATSPHRRARLIAFLNPNLDPGGIGYHINQSLIALGSGGLLGVGLGESRQKYGYIPEVTTDSIFAVVGNELGFIGSAVLIVAFLLLIYRGFKVAAAAPDRFSSLFVVGVMSWIGVQAFLNIAGLAAVLPLAGVPLPFISYGGSSLVSTILAIAMVLNISRYTKVREGKRLQV